MLTITNTVTMQISDIISDKLNIPQLQFVIVQTVHRTGSLNYILINEQFLLVHHTYWGTWNNVGLLNSSQNFLFLPKFIHPPPISYQIQGPLYLLQCSYLCFHWQESWHVHKLLLLPAGQVVVSMRLQLSVVTNDYSIKYAVTVQQHIHVEWRKILVQLMDRNDDYTEWNVKVWHKYKDEFYTPKQ